jgi:diguanylate cyclase (GGDEF)-like protein
VGWAFDLRSAILFAAAMTLVTVVLLLCGWRSLPPTMRPALRWWLASLVLHAGGAALVATRGLGSPWLGFVLANGVLGLALGCMAIAMRVFYGLPARRGAHGALAGATAAWTAWFLFVQPLPRLRLAGACLLLALAMASAARAVFRPGARAGRVPRLTAGVFAATAAILAARVAAEAAGIPPPLSLRGWPPYDLLCVGAMLLLPGLATVGFLLMCTERSQAELERSARLDHLTGLFNRRAIEELAAAAISAARRHAQPLAVLLVDVDHFKDVNDAHGHEAGDAALVEAVHRMRAVLRTEDVIGRQGGEEFVAVMPGVDLARAGAAAERLRASFAGQSMCLGDTTGRPELGITVSIGVAALQPGDAHWTQLLRRADRAMYAAKAAGRNTVCIDLAG